ncbi:MAG: hypothetical protein WBQ21_01635 [Solirubrobacteraceae bacterium]
MLALVAHYHRQLRRGRPGPSPERGLGSSPPPTAPNTPLPHMLSAVPIPA